MKKLIAEFLGSFLLLNAVVGSGIMATNLTDNSALQLLINAVATVAMLAVIISVFAEISGAHLNPVVSLYLTLQKQMHFNELIKYVAVQILGAIVGTLTANEMFGHKILEISSHQRNSAGTLIGELIATFGLLLVITAKAEKAAVLVPAWIGSAYFFTSSTSFANPAVTIGRIFTDSFSGIAPGSVPWFIAAQISAIFLISIVSQQLIQERI